VFEVEQASLPDGVVFDALSHQMQDRQEAVVPLPQAKCCRTMFVASAKMLPTNARCAVAHNSSM